jgi:hypothetical protein
LGVFFQDSLINNMRRARNMPSRTPTYLHSLSSERE